MNWLTYKHTMSFFFFLRKKFRKIKFSENISKSILAGDLKLDQLIVDDK